MGADSKYKSLTLSRGVGQSIFIGTSLDQKNLGTTYDIRIDLSGLYRTRRSTVARLNIRERDNEDEVAELEVVLAEKHSLPVTIQYAEIFYTGVKQHVVEETECMRCGSAQDPKPQRRLNGLITIRAPANAQICRGNRLGKKAR